MGNSREYRSYFGAFSSVSSFEKNGCKMKKLWKLTKGRIERVSKENVFNSFGKGVDKSISLNWDMSSGDNCSVTCRHHRDSTAENATHACYSTTAESMRPSVRDSLGRKGKMSPLEIIGLAYIQLGELFTFLDSRGEALEFFRMSSAGSVPPRDSIPEQERKRYETIFRLFCLTLVKRGVAIHFPVEDVEKWEYYHSIVGDIVTVRLSLQNVQSETSENRPCSFVVGEDIRSANSKTVKRDRIALAKKRAHERYIATGRKTIVCPAIVSTFEKRESKIQCGQCDACSRRGVDVVYPLHV